MAVKTERRDGLRVNNAKFPNENEISLAQRCLTSEKGFFIDKETFLLLTRNEVSTILQIPFKREDNVGAQIIGDLATREQLREWSNLPEGYNKGVGISFLSLIEYLVRKRGGIVGSDGSLSTQIEQINMQKSIIGEVLKKIPNWRDRIRLESIPVLLQ